MKAMKELSDHLWGIALVLASVRPYGVIPGITGRLYQQIRSDHAISVMLSAFNALTLSPALGVCCCAKTRGRNLQRGGLSGNSLTLQSYWERSTNGFVRCRTR